MENKSIIINKTLKKEEQQMIKDYVENIEKNVVEDNQEKLMEGKETAEKQMIIILGAILDSIGGKITIPMELIENLDMRYVIKSVADVPNKCITFTKINNPYNIMEDKLND